MTKERILNRQSTRRIFTQKVFTSSLLRVWTVCPPLQVCHRYSPLLAKHTNCTQTTSAAPANVLWYNAERTRSNFTFGIGQCLLSIAGETLWTKTSQVFFTQKQKQKNRNMYLKTSENGCLRASRGQRHYAENCALSVTVESTLTSTGWKQSRIPLTGLDERLWSEWNSCNDDILWL